MNAIDAVYVAIKERHPIQKIKDTLNPVAYSLKDLTAAFDYVFRCRYETRNVEKARCFIVLYNAIRTFSQVPSFPDPFNGMVPKKVKDIDSFIKEYSNSIFSFVPYIEGVMNNEG